MTPESNPELVTPWFGAAKFELAADDIHCWRASLDCNQFVLAKLEGTLSTDERARADRFVFETDRNHFIAARGILRELLGAYLKQHPARLEFSYGPQGKPALDSEKLKSPLRFNLSHSHGLAVYAFACGHELGIDVEKIVPTSAGAEIAERFFSTRELAELHTMPRERRDEGFFLCWTRKEAYIKARGGGLQIPLHSFHVSLTPGQPAELCSEDSPSWTLRSLQPRAGYAAAIVGEGKNWRLRHYEWTP